MNTSNDPVDQDRRRLLGTATLGIAAASASGLFTSQAGATTEDDNSIRPFRVEAREAALDDLRRRIAATRWPDQETVRRSAPGRAARDDAGSSPATGQPSTTGARPRRGSTRCRSYVTEIDGLDIHFIHVRSKHADALPLIVTHGWPGSVIEQLKIVGPLTDPTAHGGSAADAFDVVIPSLPGHGFSGKPTATGWDPIRIAQRLGRADAAPRLHAVRGAGRRLGERRHGADGAAGAAGLLGIHTNMPATVPDDIQTALAFGSPPPAGLSADERRAWDQLDFFYKHGLGYASEMNNRPQTLYGDRDSPVGLAAWMLDHDAAQPGADRARLRRPARGPDAATTSSTTSRSTG